MATAVPEILSLRCAGAPTSELEPLALVAPPGGLEPPTVCLEGSCSIPLSYGGLPGIDKCSACQRR